MASACASPARVARTESSDLKIRQVLSAGMHSARRAARRQRAAVAGDRDRPIHGTGGSTMPDRKNALRDCLTAYEGWEYLPELSAWMDDDMLKQVTLWHGKRFE